MPVASGSFLNDRVSGLSPNLRAGVSRGNGFPLRGIQRYDYPCNTQGRAQNVTYTEGLWTSRETIR